VLCAADPLAAGVCADTRKARTASDADAEWRSTQGSDIPARAMRWMCEAD
jgi:hypothetical protein